MVLDTLEECSTELISNALTLHKMDSLFKVQRKDGRGVIFILVEHQSTADKFKDLRSVGYMLIILDKEKNNQVSAGSGGSGGSERSKHPNSLPLVIPIIFFNGPRPYQSKTNFFDLFGENAKVMKTFFTEGFPVVDLNTIPDETLLESKWSGLCSVLMKHIRDDNLQSILEELLPVFQLVESEGGGGMIEALLQYCLMKGNLSDSGRFEFFWNTLQRGEGGNLMKNLYEQWVGEGEQKGLARGRQEGEKASKLEIARNLLQQACSLDFIRKITHLPKKEIKALQLDLEMA